jgi:hypothetical protein
LRIELKNAKRLESLSKKSGVDSKYLILLRREIEGWFPKPSPLNTFDRLPKSEIAKLEKAGVHDTLTISETAGTPKARASLSKSTGACIAVIDALSRCADFSQVQWVSPTTARMLVESGCDRVSKLAAANGEELYRALERVNAGGRFFKGKIGLRDVKRLICAAGYVKE